MNKKDELNEMLINKREKLNQLQESGNDPFKIEKFPVDSYSSDIIENFPENEEKEVTIAGRMMSKRRHGKICFIDIRDFKGDIQVFARKDVLMEKYEDVKSADIGDIIGVSGEVFKTKAGEISVRAKTFVLLSKSLQILPEKFHGLKDPDLRYRQRYVDLIVNPEVKELFLKRTQIIRAIRRFLDDRGFLEVETPILGTVAGGANARPFLTHHNTLDLDMQLRIANELFLKRLIVGGFDKVYEMGKMFRNEGMDTRHNPEFTNIELYQAYVDYEEMMRITEQMFEKVATEVTGSPEIIYDGKKINLKAPWERLSMKDAVKKYANIDFDEIDDDFKARAVANDMGIEIEENASWGEVLAEIFEHSVEDKLMGPIFITGHPTEISPLAKKNPDDPRITQRFEAFINTWELANAFSELNDPIDQKERFLRQVEQKEAGDEEAHPMDYDFINAIEVGLPPTGGLGIGVDRMIMLLTNAPSIRDIIFFPTMKPLSTKEETEEEIES